MERGTPDQDIYTFEARPGGKLEYPGEELWTRDAEEAAAYGQEYGCRVIVNRYEFEDSELFEEAPALTCRHCEEFITQNLAGTEPGKEADVPWEDANASDRLYCEESPDHEHHPVED